MQADPQRVAFLVCVGFGVAEQCGKLARAFRAT
ncbi:DUF3265 domain-containing protein [Vibrio vulnificus]|nr:DUF3265 domain-containing protein [Vibrio vulnificus]